jgi:hypothetical protein
MPIIEGADLTSVDTGFKNYPEGSYKVHIKEVEHFENRQVRIKTEIIEADEPSAVGKPFTHFINYRNADGSINQYGIADIKRYLEAIYGKKSPESLTADTDLLHDKVVLLYLNERADKNDPDKLYQNVKKILPA